MTITIKNNFGSPLTTLKDLAPGETFKLVYEDIESADVYMVGKCTPAFVSGLNDDERTVYSNGRDGKSVTINLRTGAVGL